MRMATKKPPETLLSLICQRANIDRDVDYIALVWASPPCRTFSPADYSNILGPCNHHFRDHSQPHKPPTNTNPSKARVAKEHGLLVQYILDFYAYLKAKGAQFKSAMENPRGSDTTTPAL